MKTIDALQIGSEWLEFVDYVLNSEPRYEDIKLGVFHNASYIPPVMVINSKISTTVQRDTNIPEGHIYFMVISITRMEYVQDKDDTGVPGYAPIEYPYAWVEYTPQAPETYHNAIHQTLKARLNILREDYVRRFQIES